MFYSWFRTHAILQSLVTGPIIFVGWYYGWATSEEIGRGHFVDPHQRLGLTLLTLYIFQVLLGMFIHWVKIPKSGGPFGPGTRRLQNYFHVFLGLVIFVLAAAQVYYGLFIEWEYAFDDAATGETKEFAFQVLKKGPDGSGENEGTGTGNDGNEGESEFEDVPLAAKRAWLGIIVAFWALYLIGMVLLPRQFRKEKEYRERLKEAGHLETTKESIQGR
ncbi:hypothetical protein E1B28_010463 [Marasmius oreades]|uniref:Cytochrome b561 domain-containing protein n=1 Tax=Marasmius oreades TaxID=181124 RepID=A0A9P7UR60_9AGAR|nr:uncharacterized protein E1B28_010463 [Marasmius oreades]KAG7091427.1 hypothetical protein E1B28_010463 [Marasmius oreades]